MSVSVKQTKTSITSKNGWLTGSLEYEVLSSDNASDALAILRTPGLPRWGDTIGNTKSMGYIQGVTATRSGADRLSGKFRWVITASVANTSESRSSDKPATEASKFSISRHSEELVRVRAADVHGKVNTNTNGEFFEQGLEQKIPIVVWTFMGRLTFNPDQWAPYEKSVNNNVQWGVIGPGMLLFDSLSYTHNLDENYWDTTIVIKWNGLGWNDLRANMGFYARGGDGLLYRIRNDDGSPKETPSFLNADGSIGLAPFYLEFQNQPDFDMSILGLANPMITNYIPEYWEG